VTVPVRRYGGRLLIIDPVGRLLLIHERLEDGSTHWLTPGGGVEPGEHPRDAAAREAAEEVGLDVSLPADAQAVLETRRLWSWAGIEYDQTDHFYVLRVSAGFEPRPRGLTAVERETLLGFGWWTAADLAATDQVLLPADLASVLVGALA
jgi:8-oxo-dGTP pyrophosphatase MutT (NUDIX family)